MTGGGGGLGRCYGLAMAKAGAAVAVADINLDAAKATTDAIVKAGGRAIAVHADVTKAAEFERLLDRTEAEFGPLDVLLNIAGMFPRKALVDMPEEEWDAVITLNLKDTGVRINCFGPGATDTPLWRVGKSNEDIRRLLAAGFVYQPDDFSNVVVFLASEMSAPLTGDFISRDLPR